MYPAVCEVTSQKDFSLIIVLDNGEKRTLDMKPYLYFGVFKKFEIMKNSSVYAWYLTQLNGMKALTLILNSSTRKANLNK